MEIQEIVGKIAPPLNSHLAQALLKSFVELEKRFVLGDWKPAILESGHFCEICSRIIYHIDSGNLAPRKQLNDCLRYIENEAQNIQHLFPERRTALLLSRILRSAYKIRSQRGAVHFDPQYSANESDAKYVLSASRWIVPELLRIFWQGDSSEVVRIVKEIIKYEAPSLLKIKGRNLVLRTDCTIEEEILILLHDAGENGKTFDELKNDIPKNPGSIRNALNKLRAANLRQVIQKDNLKSRL